MGLGSGANAWSKPNNIMDPYEYIIVITSPTDNVSLNLTLLPLLRGAYAFNPKVRCARVASVSWMAIRDFSRPEPESSKHQAEDGLHEEDWNSHHELSERQCNKELDAMLDLTQLVNSYNSIRHPQSTQTPL